MTDILEGWEFIRARATRRWLNGKGAGELIDLPHCWNTSDTFQIGVEYYRGWGSYRRRIQWSGGGCNLQSYGFYGTGDVWLNGRKVASFDASFLGINIPLPLENGENLLAVRLTNRCSRNVMPGIQMPDFCLYGGLAGGLFLNDDRPVVWHSVPTVKNGKGTVLTLHDGLYSLRDQDGKVVAERSNAGLLSLEKPQLWSPDNPHSYTLEQDGRRGLRRHRIGFLETAFTCEGFFLNGERYELHGLNRHQSMPGFGNVLEPAQHREDAQLIKQAGANIVRLSHYPQHPAFLDACDELGVFVLPEIATWKSVRAGGWLRNAKLQLREMLLRYATRPSVIAWGLGNESRACRPYLELKQLVREHDDRPTIYAENHLHRAIRKRTVSICEIYGCNYEFDKIEAAHREGNGPVLITEGASHWAVPGDWEAEEQQLSKMSALFEASKKHPCVAGFTMWCFADYATLRKKRYTRYSGIVDAWRVPKAGYWYFKAMYSPEPFVKLMAQWSEGEGRRRIRIFTSGESTGLLCGGEPVATFKGRGYHSIDLDFNPVPLVATAGSVSDTLYPWGSPARLALRAEQEGSLLITVLDASGRQVCDFQGKVRIHGAGGATAICYSPESISEVFNGTGRAFYRGSGRIVASCSGLPETSIDMQAG